MAHLWFGDLVTMAWWDNLWLNEGFATWMEQKATSHFNPAWDVELDISQSKDEVMQSDARPSTHPIHWERLGDAGQNPVFFMKEKGATLEGVPCGTLIKLNAGDIGYYRVQYSAEMYQQLRAKLQTLSTTDLLNLLGDTWALAEAGKAPVTKYLEMAQDRLMEAPTKVALQILANIQYLDYLEIGRMGRPAFQAYARRWLAPLLEQLGWKAKPNEKESAKLLRAHLIWMLGKYGDPAIKTESQRRFQAFLKDPASLPADLRQPVLLIVGRFADEATYQQLETLAKKSDSFSEQEEYYTAMQSALDPRLAAKTLQSSLKAQIPPQIANSSVYQVALAAEQPELAWDFALQHLKELLAREDFFGKQSLILNLMAAFSDETRADELERFSQANMPKEFHSGVSGAGESIRFRAQFKQREIPLVDAWIQRQQ